MDERKNVPRWRIDSSCHYKVLADDTSSSGGLLEDINLLGATGVFKKLGSSACEN